MTGDQSVLCGLTLEDHLHAACLLTCMRFMASLIWSRWWAELSASSRMSVSLSSFSLSSFFSCRMISASASVHSHSLRPRHTQGGGGREGGGSHLRGFHRYNQRRASGSLRERGRVLTGSDGLV